MGGGENQKGIGIFYSVNGIGLDSAERLHNLSVASLLKHKHKWKLSRKV